jgi:peroxiredoxin/outer membrane lipoprotein-sorting protein
MKLSKVLAVTALFLLPAAALGGSKSLTADQILQQVGQTYQHLQCYRIVATRSTSVVSDSAGRLPGAEQIAFDLAVQKPGKVRLDYKQSNDVLVVGDGSVTWWYSPQKKEYVKNEVAISLGSNGGAAPGGGGRDLVTDANDTLVLRYCDLARYSGECDLERPKTLTLDGRKERCYVLKISLPGSTHIRWVSEESFLVLRHDESDLYKRGQLSGTVIYSVRVKRAVVGGTLDPGLFEFTPPGKAREVASLGLPGEGAYLVGMPASGFALKDDLGGDRVSLSDYRGKVILLAFWATWCPPCRRELPTIAKLYAAYKNKGLVVLGINKEGSGTVKRFFKKQGLSFPTLDDPGGHVFQQYSANAIPQVVIIDGDGVVRARYVGGRTEQDLLTAARLAGLRASL